MTWHREFPDGTADDILDIIAKAMMIRSGGSVVISKQEMVAAREAQAEAMLDDEGNFLFRIERN